jgi:glycosyltransferase involved in cell wall biosynthesis
MPGNTAAPSRAASMHRQCSATMTSQDHRPNILFVLSSLSIGGSERKIVRLANALSRRGRTVAVAYLNPPEDLLPEIDPGVRTVHLERRGKFSFAVVARLRELIVAHSIDVVVSINLYSTLYAGLVSRFRRTVPATVRFVSSINTTDLRSRKLSRQMIIYRPVLKGMDLVIFGSEFQREAWLHQHLRQGAPRTSVLYNGVDVEFFDATRVDAELVPGWPPSRFVVGSVGVLRAIKSHEHLIEAVALLRERGCDVGAAFVGSGDREQHLRALAAQLGVQEFVHFFGAQSDVRPYIAGFDVFVLTSATETFSNAVLEALAMGRPVVASAVGGMPEMLSEGGGVVYQYGTAAALADALQPFVMRSEYCDAVASEAREVVMRRFKLDGMIDRFEALIDSVCEAGEPSGRILQQRATLASAQDSSH